MLLELTEGVHLAFTDPRRFGRVRLIDQPMTKEPLNKLGFDPILSMPPLEELRELLLRERRAIKGAHTGPGQQYNSRVGLDICYWLKQHTGSNDVK